MRRLLAATAIAVALTAQAGVSAHAGVNGQDNFTERQHQACETGDSATCAAFNRLIGEQQERRAAELHAGRSSAEPDLDARLHLLHDSCARGDGNACGDFHQFVSDHPDQSWAWKLDHPDWFAMEGE